MTLAWIRRFTGKSAAPATSAPAAAAAAVAAPGVLRYPPADTGIALVSATDLVSSNADLMQRLRLHAAMSTEQFSARFEAPLMRLAEHINVLPASAAGLFSGEGGLFRAGLESAFYSFQASDGRIFTGSEGVERRHALETRWRYLCFLGGMFYPLGRTLERAAVANASGAVWKRHLGGLTQWAERCGAHRIYVSWGRVDEAHELGPSNASLALLPGVVGADNLQHLEDGSSDLIADLYQLVAGQGGSARIAHQVISGCWERIERREAARRPQAFGRLVSGTHQGPYLIGAVRALVDQGTWKVNESCLKADSDGVYLQWPAGAADLIAFGVARDYPGWPQDAPTLAALLAAGKVVEERSSDLGMLEIVDEAGAVHKALKFANPLAVLEDFDPEALTTPRTLDRVLQEDPLEGRAAAATTAPAPQPSAAVAVTVAAPTTAPDSSTAPASHVATVEGSLTAPPATEATGAPKTATPATEPGSGSAAPVEAPGKTARTQQQPGKLVEAPEVRYSDLVPEELQKDIGNGLQIELLGKMVKAWRDRGEAHPSMRRVDNGAAFSLIFLSQHMRDVPTWVDAMARAGLIYSPPSTPGLRVQKVSIPEGKKATDAVVLSTLACRRLGL